MVQRGEVRLTDPVASLLHRGGVGALARRTADHAGGPRHPHVRAAPHAHQPQPKDPSNPAADYTVEQLYEFLGGYTLTRDPGSQYEYSNLGVGLLAHALALRARESYERLVQRAHPRAAAHGPHSIALTVDMARHLATGHYTRGSHPNMDLDGWPAPARCAPR